MFSVADWSAWSPTIQLPEDWNSWAKDPFPLNGESSPTVNGMSASNRRRLNRLGQISLAPLYQLPESNAPIIYCSQYGEINRSYGLLKQITEGDLLSPQAFSMSVHNSIPCLHRIDLKNHSNVISVASSTPSLSGLVEAIGLFSQGEESVRLMVCEDNLPVIYGQDNPHSNQSYGYVIDLKSQGNISIEISDASENPNGSDILPVDLRILSFLISEQFEQTEILNGARWRLWRS